MKIDNFRSEKQGPRARVTATIRWEDCERPTQDVYFETDDAFAPSLSCNPHAFLIASIVPAIHYGEKRVFLDAEICPELRHGLMTAMSWMRHWYYQPERELVRIEAKTQADIPTPRRIDRAGFFFSGGIDSFAMLRANRLHVPPQHPGFMQDALLVYGLELDAPEAFEHVVHSLSEVVQEAGITLIRVYTNLYLHYRYEDAATGFSFWYHELMGAALAAVAHALAPRLTVASIASDYDIPNQRPHGSHPLLDPNYSSRDLHIRHDGITLSRFAKTKLAADWDVALQHLRVCNQYKRYGPGRLNCGQWEKCVRTMLALVALGVLDKTGAFPVHDVSADMLRSIKLSHSTVPLYDELIAPLVAKGRQDLARAVERKIAEHDKRQRIIKRHARMKQIDQQHLGGSLVAFKRLMSSLRGI